MSTTPTRIALIGGHGKVALRLAPLLVRAGHQVTAIVRNPDHCEEVAATGATPLVADIERLDADGFVRALEGHDVVVWSAGAGGGNPGRTYAVDRDAAIASMEAARAVGARRYVMVSYFGAGPGHGVPRDNSFFDYAEAKAAADVYLADTDLDWTILRPSTLTSDAGTGRIELGPDASVGQVSRDDVAAVAAAVVDDPRTVRHAIDFNNGDTDIAAALDAVAERPADG